MKPLILKQPIEVKGDLIILTKKQYMELLKRAEVDIKLINQIKKSLKEIKEGKIKRFTPERFP